MCDPPQLQSNRSDARDEMQYTRILGDIVRFGNHLLVTRHFEKLSPSLCSTLHFTFFDRLRQGLVGDRFQAQVPYTLSGRLSIDLWLPHQSHQLSSNVGFLLGFLLTRAPQWARQVYIRVLSVVDPGEDVQLAEQNLLNSLEQMRIPCEEVQVYPYEAMLAATSRSSSTLKRQEMARAYNQFIRLNSGSTGKSVNNIDKEKRRALES